ncbi:hypothetical protein FUAX_11970 [Fulvitalea axinellae]|uniref:HTH cro/C1-type domain-containing protein n=1 Tax=Fulvitalea axinellae TaxID=1182444 RepID=A0AAU9CHN8_9BACT|nr:hypothetical protein FUAX_11970 [Fulvitalea axinellae]
MSLISRNIRYLRKRAGLTQAKFAEKIGIKRSLVGAYEEGRSDPRWNNLLSISRLFDISVDALISYELDGASQDELLKYSVRLNESGVNVAQETKILAITVNDEEKENIELVPQRASAGYTNGYSDPEYIRDLPKFQLPFLPGSGTYRAFEISGDSMLPLESGTIVVGQYVESVADIVSGKTYVLVTQDEGVVYKRVFNYLHENGKLFLSSDNQTYTPYEIDASSVKEVWSAKAFISVHFPDHNNSLDAYPAEPMTLEKLTSIVLELREEIVRLREENA